MADDQHVAARVAPQDDTRDPRAGRLYPRRSSQAYWVLTRLRQSLEDIGTRFFTGAETGMLVDFGCGSMPYRPIFERHVAAYVGCDLRENPRADRHIESISRLPFDPDTVSAILSTQVLEHVENPSGYLDEAFRVLKSGGLLVLTTHGAWRYHPDPTDYWRWTSAGLRKQVAEAGFSLIDFKGLLGPVATSLQLVQDNVRGKLPYRLRKFFVFGMQYLVEWTDRRCGGEERDSDACVYVVVAAKP